jgi:hypothetical protein
MMAKAPARRATALCPVNSEFFFFRASGATRITVDHTALVKAKGTKAAKPGMTKKTARAA